jgi:hypothetical protein
MVERREHQPKLAALGAYRSERLSPSARARIERHLAACELCRQALLGMQRYAVLVEEARAVPSPAIDWSRMELPLAREATRLVRRRQARRMAGALALAAAVGIGLFVAREPARPRSMRQSGSSQMSARPAPEALPLRTQITAIVGAVEGTDASGRHMALDLGSSPAEGWAIETGAQSELHLALGATAELIVPPSSRLALRSLREAAVELSVARGQVINHVHTLGSGSRYEIVAAAHRMAVRGTRFSVELGQQGLAVQVDEGMVAVMGENGVQLAELHAPQRWQDASGATAAAVRSVEQGLRRPHQLAQGSASWPVLEIPSWPHVIGWEVDRAELSAGAELRMRVPLGDLDILATLDDGRRMRGHIHMDAVGARFDPRGLRLLGPQAVQGPSREVFDPARAALVIREGGPALQRCYERSLRGLPDAPSGPLHARLRIELDLRGRVKRVELAGTQTLSALLGDCVRRVAEGWRFPTPGKPGIIFEAPISFRPTHE